MERIAANKIMEVIRNIGCELSLDDLTLGAGNCMIIAIIQQCKREDIFPLLPGHIQTLVLGTITVIMTTDFRRAVKDFVTERETDPDIRAISEFLPDKSWSHYWKKMIKPGVWGDGVFLRCTALLLRINILVVHHGSEKDDPYFCFIGRPEPAPAGDNTENLYLGYTGMYSGQGQENHYQSLLPSRTAQRIVAPPVFDFTCEKSPQLSPQQKGKETNRKRQKDLKDFRKSAKSQPKPNLSEEEKKAEQREKERKKKAAKRARQKAADPEKYTVTEARKRALRRDKEKAADPEKYSKGIKDGVANHRAAKRAKNEDLYKAGHNERVSNQRAKEREKDEIKFKMNENQRKQNSAENLRKINYPLEKTKNKDKQARSRAKRTAQFGKDRENFVPARKQQRVETANDRLKEFRLVTMIGADYICVSCHGKCFKQSVVKLTDDLESKIDLIFPDPENDWISDRNLVTNIHIEAVNVGVPAEYKNSEKYARGGDRYICKTCQNWLRKRKRIPPCSVMNGLQLFETDQELKEQNLMLTDIEAAMVATMIHFQLIKQLPKSMWSALKNTSVLVPIEPDRINQTLDQMPRLPSQAGLIPIKFKRKQSYENNHYRKLVQVSKLFNFVQKMKDYRNPHYEEVAAPADVETSLQEFKEKCKITDKRGYKLVYDDDENDSTDEETEEEEETEQSIAKRKIEELAEQQEFEEEENYIKNDVVKKYQLVYDETVGLIDNCPEITIAPGEGAKPVNTLYEKHWDVKAFPNLFNPDGTGGFDDPDRPYPIRLQEFYKQRFLNKEPRFSETPAYLFAAVSHLESRRISSNISMVGRRGKKSVVDGQTQYQLEDAWQVTANVPNGPGYQKQLKNDILARLDDQGAFQFFFTLSCADLRWDPIFASILLKHGYSLNFKCKSVDGVFTVETEARTGDGKWKPIKEFIENDIKESNHELVRGNVGLATRYFDNRLKQFISKIVMPRSNLMCVTSYTWRIEMQGRGAAHSHGTLHCDLKKLERLIIVDGELTDPPDNPLLLPKPVEDYDRPMKGLADSFTKLRNDIPLAEENLLSLCNFITQFVTVSTHIPTVGKDVAEIALQVQNHRHTKTCKKHNTVCRFNFPKPPAPRTIIRIPVKKERRSDFVEAQKLIEKVMEVVTEPKIVEEIMSEYEKDSEEAGTDHEEKREERIRKVCQRAGVNYDNYLEALALSGDGYKYHLARDIDEIFINPFNVDWLRAWNGNLDLQVTLDFFAVITYVTDYFTKGDTALLNAMKVAVKDNSCADVKEKMKILSRLYVRLRQIGESEAWYRLLPGLMLTKSNVKCKFAPTAFLEERSHMYRLATEKQIKAGVPCVKLAGKEGLWYEQPDVWSKYLRRPPQLDDMCFAQFVKMYDSCSSKQNSDNSKHEEDNIDEIQDEEEVEEEDLEELELEDFYYYEYDHIMTFLDNGKKGKRLPKTIDLQDPIPGEAAQMKKRRRAAALRFYKGYKKDPVRFMHQELMLYTPLRDEIPRESIEALYLEEFEGERKVSRVKRQVMPFLQSVEEARLMVDEMQKELELDHSETGVNLDPQAEQENEECEEEGEQDHPDFLHLDPGQLAQYDADSNSGNTRQPLPFSRIEVPPSDELYQSINRLDRFQVEVVNIALQYFRDLVKARKNGNPKPVAPLLMVNGGAGAGKSTVINAVAKIGQKTLAQDGDNLDQPKIVIGSFTGTAASNVNGQTLHNIFGFSYTNSKDTSGIDSRKLDMKRLQFQKIAMVIVDEISMTRVDMLYAMDDRLQDFTQNYGKPFGGVAVLFFGDLMQLKPVMGSWIFDKPNNHKYQPLHEADPRWPMFKSLVLENNHRQGEDKTYADLLNRIRVGNKTVEDMELLQTRVRPDGHKDLKDAALFICCTKKSVSKYNRQYIRSLPGEMISLKAYNINSNQKEFKPKIDDKDGTVGSTNFKDLLQLKKEAKIIMIFNVDTSDGLTNGQLGKLVDVIWTKETEQRPRTIDKLVVRFNDPKVGEKSRQKNPTLSNKFAGCVIIERAKCQYYLSQGNVASATVYQFPIWPAHAITCHKIQGQSIPAPNKVVVNIDDTFRNGGPLAYVAMSRCQNITQMLILNNLDESKIVCDAAGREETENLRLRSWNENPSPWLIPDNKSLKIASLNCARLRPHFQYIQNNDRLMRADVIHLQETCLDPNTTSDLSIENYEEHFVNVGNGKGIATYHRDSAATFHDYKSGNFQVTKMTVQGVVSINVYRSAQGNQTDLVSVLQGMIDESQDQPILVSGDLNICTMDKPNNTVTKGLRDLGLKLLVDVATHIRGGHIDHLYWRGDPTGVWREPSLENNLIERYSPYFTDHDAWLVTLQRKTSSN